MSKLVEKKLTKSQALKEIDKELARIIRKTDPKNWSPVLSALIISIEETLEEDRKFLYKFNRVLID